MNHEQAIEKAAFVLVHSALDTQAIYLIDAKKYAEAAITTYLAARDCVLAPRKYDGHMEEAINNVFVGPPLDDITFYKALYIALIADIDRREREAGK